MLCGCFTVFLVSTQWALHSFFFFFNDTATTEIYTLSLHDALPISQSTLDAAAVNRPLRGRVAIAGAATYGCGEAPGMDDMTLLVRAAHAAVADAGLTMQDIDGLATCSVNASMWTIDRKSVV